MYEFFFILIGIVIGEIAGHLDKKIWDYFQKKKHLA
jgi:hypothetical protein